MHMDCYLGNVMLTRHGNAVLLDTYTLEKQKAVKQRLMNEASGYSDNQIPLKQLERMYLTAEDRRIDRDDMFKVLKGCCLDESEGLSQ